MAVNPGYAGNGNEITITTIQRNQWVGFDGAPQTTLFTISAPVQLFGQKHGLGLEINNDVISFTSNFSLKGSYAYRHMLSSGELGGGLSLGLYNYQLQSAQFEPGETGDPVIPTGDQRDMVFDAALGAYYSSSKWFVGFSVQHLTAPQLKFEKSGGPKLRPHYYLAAGYSINLANPSYEIQPSVFIQSDGVSNQYNANATFIYNKKMWLGVSYRVGDAITGIVGLELFNGIKLSYAYDMTTSRLSNYSNGSRGSHEILLLYGFSIYREKIQEQFKSVRFL